MRRSFEIQVAKATNGQTVLNDAREIHQVTDDHESTLCSPFLHTGTQKQMIRITAEWQ